jgi:hypothetical protein
VDPLSRSNRGDDRFQVVAQAIEVVRCGTAWSARGPHAAEVIGDHVVAVGEARHEGPPKLFGVREAVDENHGRVGAVAGLDHGQSDAILRRGPPLDRVGNGRLDRSGAHAARIYTLVRSCSLDVERSAPG